MLFSEPKIPQLALAAAAQLNLANGFSALQRAENSSIPGRLPLRMSTRLRFSALQRAENSSILRPSRNLDERAEFQCSSASRKFLNSKMNEYVDQISVYGFSALQRAENSSIAARRVPAICL